VNRRARAFAAAAADAAAAAASVRVQRSHHARTSVVGTCERCLPGFPAGTGPPDGGGDAISWRERLGRLSVTRADCDAGCRRRRVTWGGRCEAWW
jgi:hypothetical protein